MLSKNKRLMYFFKILMELIEVCILYVGERLYDFKILVGDEFTFGNTDASEIRSWSQCASVSGKYLFQLFVFTSRIAKHF